MKVTDSKDTFKVNAILPIMQVHFGNHMNLARIKLMALLLHALCVVQTVSLHKLAAAMPTALDRDSNLRRLQRFIAGYALSLDIVAKMIFSLLPCKDKLVLSMDRTNWKFGNFNINILMLGVTHKGIAFPLIFSLLDKRGNSNWEECKKLMEWFIRLFGEDCIDCLVAMVCIALVWAYLVGDHKDINVKPIRILKHGHRAKSIVKYGLEEISNVLLRPTYTPKFDVFKFLSCS